MIIADDQVDSEGLAACERLVQQKWLQSVRYFRQIDSTNSQAMQELDSESLQLPKLHLADEQTAGRGRQGRSWLADDGTLTFTLTVADDRFAAAIRTHETSMLPLPLTIGLALARTVEQCTDGVEPKLKWPNDVYIGDQKLAGILIESSIKQPTVRVIGVGINIATRLLDSIDDFGPCPISIIERCTRHPRRYQWLQPCIENMLQCIAESFDHVPELIDEYRQRCPLTHHEVQFYQGDTLQTGLCYGIDFHGRLQVNVGGKMLALASGEVTKVRRI